MAESDLDRMIQLIGDQMRDTFAADIVYVALLDRQSSVINFPYQFGEELSSRRLGEGLTSKIIQTAQPILINQNFEGQLAELGTQMIGKQARSYLGVPVMAGGQAIGVISVQSTTRENAFGEDERACWARSRQMRARPSARLSCTPRTEHRAQEMATLAEIGNDIAASRGSSLC